mmetsp:Transcript_47931/g.118665  ORF Transcript_47931/g.118665 Transcript_47931/m.118665 type:complete len:214 (+) Transcript_47931:146-787(+)
MLHCSRCRLPQRGGDEAALPLRVAPAEPEAEGRGLAPALPRGVRGARSPLWQRASGKRRHGGSRWHALAAAAAEARGEGGREGGKGGGEPELEGRPLPGDEGDDGGAVRAAQSADGRGVRRVLRSLLASQERRHARQLGVHGEDPRVLHPVPRLLQRRRGPPQLLAREGVRRERGVDARQAVPLCGGGASAHEEQESVPLRAGRPRGGVRRVL